MLITEVIHERHNDKEKTGLFIISWLFLPFCDGYIVS